MLHHHCFLLGVWVQFAVEPDSKQNPVQQREKHEDGNAKVNDNHYVDYGTLE
jgi:hypothetical protein